MFEIEKVKEEVKKQENVFNTPEFEEVKENITKQLFIRRIKMTPIENELKELQDKLEKLIQQDLDNLKAILEIESKIDILISKINNKTT